ncbi:MAG: hypothetical protein ACLR9T_03030 [Thomasclavelia sp.]|uniref:hypothetical protein n=1 Tax=Thomasclavelia sp. TaxID=3025757 RepID=UPI00399F3B77
MEALFNRRNYPSLQEIFDSLYYYYQEGNRLLEFANSKDKGIAYKEAKLLRNQIHEEYHELNLMANFKFYSKKKLLSKLYHEYKKAISDMNKFAGNLSYKNLNSYLYDVYDYVAIGLFSCKSRFESNNVTTNDFLCIRY